MSTTRRGFFGMMGGALAALGLKPKREPTPADREDLANYLVTGSGIENEIVYYDRDWKELHRGPDGPVENIEGCTYFRAETTVTGEPAGGLFSIAGIAS